MTTFPAIRRPSTRRRSISTASRCPDDLDIFGYPTVALTLAVDRPTASLSIRLCELEPETGASHLVTYRFYNLAYRGGDMASPEKIEPGKTFTLRVTLNIAGHTFKKGWRIRLALSPSFYPTLWQTADAPTVTLFAGGADGFEASALMLRRDASRGSRTRRCKSCCRRYR